MIILFFGQPASGKTTLADALVKKLSSKLLYHSFVRIDGDKWREVTNNKNYSKEGRMANLKGAFDMAIYLDNDGYTPVLSFVSPYKELRDYLKSKNKVIEIFLECDADRGRNDFHVKDFEEHTDGLRINTNLYQIDDCLEKITNYFYKCNNYTI